MSTKELERLKIIEKCVSKELSQKNGAKQLNVTDRHLRRLVRSFRVKGVENKLNNRPRKVLGWLSPIEYLKERGIHV
ncbi:MAG: putative DNA-binding protein (UPF0251 family) [Francisella sp.]|jgi:predicted DNA-binding protein (UPF0251 family)